MLSIKEKKVEGQRLQNPCPRIESQFRNGLHISVDPVTGPFNKDRKVNKDINNGRDDFPDSKEKDIITVHSHFL
jgi:hypothetical protein